MNAHRKKRANRYGELRHILSSARSRIWWRVFRQGLVRTIGLAGVVLALAVVAVMLWPASWAGPVGALGVLAAALFAFGILFCLPLLRIPSLARYSRQIDEAYAASGEANEFLSALELGRSPDRRGVSPSLIEALVDERTEASRRLDLVAPGRTSLARSWKILPGAAMVVLALALAVAPARFTIALGELASPRPPASLPVTLQVLTGDLEVERGTDVIVEARLTGGEVRPTMNVRRGAGVWRTFPGQLTATSAAVAEPGIEPAAGPATGTSAEPAAGSETAAAADPATEPETAAATEPETEAAAEPETEAVAESETEAAAEPETEAVAESETEAVAAPATEPAALPQAAEDRIYRFVIPSIESETHYRVEAGGVTSPEYRIGVLEPLRIVEFQFEYRYPDYSRLETETVRATEGAVAALRGTDVTVTVETNEPLESGVLDVAGGVLSSITLTTPNRGHCTFPITEETAYTLELVRKTGKRGRASGKEAGPGATRFGPYTVTSLPDRHPLVAVLDPGEDTDVPSDLVVPITAHAADDYGLSSLSLNYSYEGGQPGRIRIARFTGYPREATKTHVWDLSSLNLLPGDVVSYYLEVYDNDTVSGPKRARTRVYTLTLPTLSELYAEVEEGHGEARSELEAVHEEGLELMEELRRIAREMTKFPVADWEDKQEIAQAFERQQELRQEIEELAETLGESLSRLENQSLVDQEVLEKVSEIQKLMEQISDKDLQDAFRRLGEQLSQLDQREVEKALQDLTMTHEELLKNLEKTIEMLKQVQLEEMMQQAVEQAEEMVEKQDEINEDLEQMSEDEGSERSDTEGEAENGEESEQASDEQSSEGEQDRSPQSQDEELQRLAAEEESNIENAEELSKLLEELAKELEAMREERSKELERLSEEAGEQSEMQSSMKSALEQMADANPQGAKQSGQKSSEQMRSMLEQLRMQQQMMMNQQMAELLEKLREAARELLKISEGQELLIADERRRDAERLAEDQVRLLGATRRVNELIEEIARTSFMVGTDFAGLLGQPIRSMQNAISSYERRNLSSGRLHGYQSLAQLNETILKLLETEQSMCSGGGSCNSMKMALQSMMGLSQQQQQVNDGTRQLMQEGGQRLSEGAQQRLARLAAQQAAIQKGLEEVQETLAGRRDVLGRVDELGDEMGEVVEEMERGELDERILSKQHEILSRLLDAQRSVRKRDLGKERLSRTGEPVDRRIEVPAVPEDLLSPRERLEADILRGRSDPYPPGFRELVERYFEALVEARAGRTGGTSPN